MSQKEIISSVTADNNNKGKETQIELSLDIEKEKSWKHLIKSYIMKISTLIKK